MPTLPEVKPARPLSLLSVVVPAREEEGCIAPPSCTRIWSFKTLVEIPEIRNSNERKGDIPLDWIKKRTIVVS